MDDRPDCTKPLRGEKQLAPSSVGIAVCALRFLYTVTLQKAWTFDDVIPAPQQPRPLPVVLSKTVLQAAIDAGTSVPYYCYHPGISIDGSCRVCVVKIEKMPKLQTSCHGLHRRHGRVHARSRRRRGACRRL